MTGLARQAKRARRMVKTRRVEKERRRFLIS
jgi:hypothetical protein